MKFLSNDPGHPAEPKAQVRFALDCFIFSFFPTHGRVRPVIFALLFLQLMAFKLHNVSNRHIVTALNKTLISYMSNLKRHKRIRVMYAVTTFLFEVNGDKLFLK